MEKKIVLYSAPLTAPPVAVIFLPKCVLESFTCLMVVWYNFWGQLQMATTEPEDPDTLPSTDGQLAPSLDSFDVRFQMLVGLLQLTYS